MQIEPPSLAAKLERDGTLPWREAAGMMAEIARLLDRLHARGRVHGGVEPLAILFVGGAVRLADPLPGVTARQDDIPAPRIDGRQHDFAALGRTFAAMLGGDRKVEELPSAMRAILARCAAPDPATGFRSGNEVAEAVELALAKGDPRAKANQSIEPSVEARSVPPAPPRVASAVPAQRRRKRPDHRPLLALLGGLLLLGGVSIYHLRPTPPVPAPPGQADNMPVVPPREPVEQDDALVELLATLPDQPLPQEPDRPATDDLLRQALADAEGQPCGRLEVERFGPALRLVGRTASARDRESIMARLDLPEEAVDPAIVVDDSGRFCRLYAILKKLSITALPRLADLYPRRIDHRLGDGEPMMVLVRMPAEPSHLTVDYFTADDMVVHLRVAEAGEPRLPPFEAVLVGDPVGGPALRAGPPFGNELILVLASAAPLFSAPRPGIEQAGTYLDALEVALGSGSTKAVASTLALEVVPVTP